MYELANYKALRLLEKYRIIRDYGSTLWVTTKKKVGKTTHDSSVLTLDYIFGSSRLSQIFSLVVKYCCRLF